MKPDARNYRKLTPLADVLLQGGPTVRGGVKKLLEEYRKQPELFRAECERVTSEAKQKLARVRR